MANRTVLQPDWPWIKKFGFAPGIRTGDTIYTCGVIAFDRDGNVVGDGDCYAQTVQTFANIRELLATEGATMEDVVKITAFLPDMSRYIRQFKIFAQSQSKRCVAQFNPDIYTAFTR